MAKLVFFFVLLVALCLVEARHIHPGNMMKRMQGIAEIDGIPIDVIRNLTPNRFVPINNDIFFTGPCTEGLERDFLGICREVWD